MGETGPEDHAFNAQDGFAMDSLNAYSDMVSGVWDDPFDLVGTDMTPTDMTVDDVITAASLSLDIPSDFV